MTTTQGKLIVLEGGEASGKDANIAYLKDQLGTDDFLYTREPGGTVVSERIRDIFIDPHISDMHMETELFLLLASRAEHIEKVIRPALVHGTHVISNRFALSTVAFQIYRKKRFDFLPILNELHAHLLDAIVPHYILLDVSPEVASRRMQARTLDRIEKEGRPAYERVREGYLREIEKYEHVIINAEKPLAVVQQEVLAAVRTFITP